MTKTATEVVTDVMELLKGSVLARAVTGKVYRTGYRPRNSALEDIVVTFTTGSTGDIQSGLVTVNVFVADITPYANGVSVQNGARTAELERAAQEWVDTLTADRSNYIWSLRNTIFTTPDAVAGEHFIVIRLNYRYND